MQVPNNSLFFVKTAELMLWTPVPYSSSVMVGTMSLESTVLGEALTLRQGLYPSEFAYIPLCLLKGFL